MKPHPYITHLSNELTLVLHNDLRDWSPTGRSLATVLADIVSSGQLLLGVALIARYFEYPRHSHTLRDACEALFKNARHFDYFEFDYEARHNATCGWLWEDRESTATLLNAIPALVRSSISAVGVLSTHRDGFVRAAAVNVLASSDLPQALPFLLARCVDGVPAVRNAAIEAVTLWMGSFGARQLLWYLPMLRRLECSPHPATRALAARIIGELLEPRSAEYLLAGCHHPDRTVRRRCVPLALRCPTVPVKAVLLGAFADSDPVVRTLAARTAIDALPEEHVTEISNLMLASRVPALRYSGLELLWKWRRDLARPTLERLRFDANWRVSSTSAWFLKQIPGYDDMAFCRTGLATPTPSQMLGVLVAFSSVGDASDACLINGYTQHPRARVRAAALDALARCDLDSSATIFLTSAEDSSARVRLAARSGLARLDAFRHGAIFRRALLSTDPVLSAEALSALLKGAPVDARYLIEGVLASPFTHVRSAARSLIPRHPVWDRGALLVALRHELLPAQQLEFTPLVDSWHMAAYGELSAKRSLVTDERIQLARELLMWLPDSISARFLKGLLDRQASLPGEASHPDGHAGGGR